MEKPKTDEHKMSGRHVFSDRLLAYAARIVKVVEALPKTLVGRRIGDQLLRSGMSVGAHYEEACAAESRDDFVHKLQIALKELRESNYWLRLVMTIGALPPGKLTNILDESSQLRAMLSKAVATTKSRTKAQQRGA